MDGFVCKNSPKEALWLYKQHLLTVENGIKTGIIPGISAVFLCWLPVGERAAAAGEYCHCLSYAVRYGCICIW